MSVKRKRSDCHACLKKSGVKASEGKQMYISEEAHYRTPMIIRLLGNGEVIVANFVENVVRECLRAHCGELSRMLNAVPEVEL